MMTEEFRQTLSLMQATWPVRELSEAEVIVWGQTLAHLDADDVAEAIAVLRDRSEFFPSHAAFATQLGAVRARRHREAARDRGLRADTGDTMGPTGAVEWIARTREVHGLTSHRP